METARRSPAGARSRPGARCLPHDERSDRSAGVPRWLPWSEGAGRDGAAKSTIGPPGRPGAAAAREDLTASASPNPAKPTVPEAAASRRFVPRNGAFKLYSAKYLIVRARMKERSTE